MAHLPNQVLPVRHPFNRAFFFRTEEEQVMQSITEFVERTLTSIQAVLSALNHRASVHLLDEIHPFAQRVYVSLRQKTDWIWERGGGFIQHIQWRLDHALVGERRWGCIGSEALL